MESPEPADPMEKTDLAFAGIAAQARMLREGEVSSVELTRTYLERIERLDPFLNPFVLVRTERSLAEAAEADKRLAEGEEGRLLGVPVALKDNVDVAGLHTSHGTGAFDRPATTDAALWRRLREAGAILLAKTTMPELAILPFAETKTWGITRNPWDAGRSPGGSSSGSGAAVAAGLVGAASASDGAGSIRIPAASCGLVGLKPQRGRVSLAPDAEHWCGLSVFGCVSRRIADTALWLEVTAGSEPVDAHRAEDPPVGFIEAAAREPERLRIAWSTAALPGTFAKLDREVAAEVERVARMLERLGHEVSEIDPDWGLLGADFSVLYLKGIEAEYESVPNPGRLERRTKGFRAMARPIPDALLERSRRRIPEHAARVNRIFDRVDVLLTPTAGESAVEVGRWEGMGALRTTSGMSRVYPWTGPWNYLGNPAVSLPTGVSAAGLPLAVQAVAPPHREDRLLTLGAQLERECGWTDRRPPVG
ncbi:MAG: amidase family protein [Solirubrobacterales bacterium]